MLDRENLLALMKNVARNNPSGNYSFQGENLSWTAMNDTLRKELNELAGTEELYELNKRKVFSLIAETMDEIVPTRLLNVYGRFAEIRTFGQGDRPIFVRRVGRARAKQFITKVGIAGRYEVFQLGSETLELQTSAIGGAARIGFEEFLDGRVDFAELTAIIMEGMEELIYREIAKALVSAISSLPAANRVAVAGWDEASLDYLITTASAYGTPTIYCTREFAVKIVPSTGWISEGMKDEMWAKGYLANYKGTPVVILPQSLEDETNTKKVLDPGYVWVIPSGGNDKPVKVAFEGTTHVRDVPAENNDDWSRDVQVYRKVGVGVMMTNNIFSYVDTTLKGKLDNTNPNPNNG